MLTIERAQDPEQGGQQVVRGVGARLPRHRPARRGHARGGRDVQAQHRDTGREERGGVELRALVQAEVVRRDHEHGRALNVPRGVQRGRWRRQDGANGRRRPLETRGPDGGELPGFAGRACRDRRAGGGNERPP